MVALAMWGAYDTDPTNGTEVACRECSKLCDEELTLNGLCGDCQDIKSLPDEINDQDYISIDPYEGKLVRSMAKRSANEKRERLAFLLKRTGREEA